MQDSAETVALLRPLALLSSWPSFQMHVLCFSTATDHYKIQAQWKISITEIKKGNWRNKDGQARQNIKNSVKWWNPKANGWMPGRTVSENIGTARRTYDMDMTAEETSKTHSECSPNRKHSCSKEKCNFYGNDLILITVLTYCAPGWSPQGIHRDTKNTNISSLKLGPQFINMSNRIYKGFV